ncbi:LysM peptidoglycan-binding domain-containing protein [Sporosarcina sp. NPDC096371]|uniref:LysM peptidoglycan-binding domain-containing protein n=1 Tax=Sporosarcina sp. NPDC096371 TaxID=3364530 RepID=UPI0038056281
MEVHIVVKGDTLWKIARQYGIPFEELKRVNAHLANPDYIVPGMKIFLPNKVQGGTPEHGKHPGKGQVPVKPTHPPTAPTQPTHQKPTQPTHPKPTQPTHQKPSQPTHPKPSQPTHPKPSQPTHPKPTQPTHPKPTQPTHPKPTHPKPTQPTLPKPTPPVQVQPPRPLPTPSLPAPKPTPPVQVQPPLPLPTPSLPSPPPMPVPLPVPPAQMFPMQPCMPHMHPMIGIPCGWMPIFDADCHPFMHSGQIQAMPFPPASEEPAPLPLPTPSLPSTQFPMYEEECEESPIFSSQGPATLPQQMPMMEGWQLIESPDYQCEESPEMDLEPSAWCPPEQGYVPQALSPAMQPGYPMMPYPSYQQGCGCGCSGHHHQQHQQYQPMMMPLFYGSPCNCQSPMQSMPYQMMPTPYQGSNWYGSY